MKVAVVNMPTVFANVDANMEQARKYMKEASEDGVELIVFPEFFTTGFAVNEQLITAISKSDSVKSNLRKWSKEYQIAVGGSYLYPDRNKQEVYNEFGLYFPTGEEFTHCKDIPTALENFCYTAGDEISAFHTPLGNIGIVMCWEQLRYQTVERMAGKVDLLIGGSCWWNFTPEDGKQLYEQFSVYIRELAINAPKEIARILGVPYAHASHTGSFPGATLNGKVTCNRKIESPTMIVDAEGNAILGQVYPGWMSTKIQSGCIKNKIEIPSERYWIPELPGQLDAGFHMLNTNWSKVYEETVKPKVFQQ